MGHDCRDGNYQFIIRLHPPPSGRMCQNHGTRDARVQQHRDFHLDRGLIQHGQVTKTAGYIAIEKNGFPGTIRATRAFPATK